MGTGSATVIRHVPPRAKVTRPSHFQRPAVTILADNRTMPSVTMPSDGSKRPLQITTSRSADGWGVVADGVLVGDGVGHLEETIETLIAPGERIVIDFANITRLDTTALETILRLARRARGLGGEVRVIGRSRSFQDPRLERPAS